jgi:hypothetical protein
MTALISGCTLGRSTRYKERAMATSAPLQGDAANRFAAAAEDVACVAIIVAAVAIGLAIIVLMVAL